MTPDDFTASVRALLATRAARITARAVYAAEQAARAEVRKRG